MATRRVRFTLASMLLAALPHAAGQASPASWTADLVGPLSLTTIVAIVAALLLWIVVYLLYRVVMTRRKDFGIPVRRRLLCRRLRVDRDQTAEAPFWWTDLQIQLAVSNHWRQSLRQAFGNDPQAQL
jgi:hypothetical protein